MLYVDWYDGEHILRPMQAAISAGIPVFLNLEYGHADAETLARLAPHTTICQATTDRAQREGEAVATARKLLAAGIETVVVTLAGAGCVAARGGELLRVSAPQVDVVDGCGAGATFSAGIIYGRLHHWDLNETVRFATAAASLKCTVVGPRAFPLPDIKKMAKSINMIYHDLP